MSFILGNDRSKENAVFEQAAEVARAALLTAPPPPRRSRFARSLLLFTHLPTQLTPHTQTHITRSESHPGAFVQRLTTQYKLGTTSLAANALFSHFNVY